MLRVAGRRLSSSLSWRPVAAAARGPLAGAGGPGGDDDSAGGRSQPRFSIEPPFFSAARDFSSTETLVPRNQDAGLADLPATVAAVKNPNPKVVYDEYNHERYPPGDPSKRAFVPLLRQSEPQNARIINISSVAGHLALPFWSAYNVSKAGLDMLSECLRYELADQGIPVVCVKPGPVLTPIWDKSRQKSQDVIAGMPAGLQQLYGPTLDKMNAMVAKTEETAIPVSAVVNVIVEAATSAQPKPVYLVGKDASLNYWLKRLLPDEAWASILTTTLSSK